MKRLGVVFSAFRPDDGLIAAVRSLGATDDFFVIVVDDGSGDGFEQVWESVRAEGAEVLHAPENEGIAAALNRGIRACLAAGADAVVTFDQDSSTGPGFLSALVAAWTAAVAQGVAVGLVVPEYFAGISQVHRRRGDVLFTRHSIQSGMLIPRATLERVGLLREDLFIDLVDTEFELRCNAAGLASVGAPGLHLEHSLGRRYRREWRGRPVRLPGIPSEVTLSTPFRYYYRVRNRRVVNRAYARTAPGWIARDTLLEVIHFGIALTLAEPRATLRRLYREAWRDAGRGRMGRIPDDLAAAARQIRWTAPELS